METVFWVALGCICVQLAVRLLVWFFVVGWVLIRVGIRNIRTNAACARQKKMKGG